MLAPKDVVAGSVWTTKVCGELVVTKYRSCSDIDIKFILTGFVRKSTTGAIRSGNVRDPFYPQVFGFGCFGVGDHAAVVSGVIQGSYQCWRDMVRRCYDECVRHKFPTYKYVTVCDEWANYQTFAEWYKTNYPQDGKKYDLDKDVLQVNVKNKIYSPETCIFITQEENKRESAPRSLAKSYTMISPDGLVTNIYNMKKHCREFGLNDGAMHRVIAGRSGRHKGWTSCK